MNFRLSLLKVPVRNLAASVPFYRDSLGMVEKFVAEQYGWAQLSAGDLDLALYVPGLGGGEGPIGGSLDFHLALSSEEFDQLVEVFPSSLHQGNDGTTFLEVVDPDLNSLKIFRLP